MFMNALESQGTDEGLGGQAAVEAKDQWNATRTGLEGLRVLVEGLRVLVEGLTTTSGDA